MLPRGLASTYPSTENPGHIQHSSSVSQPVGSPWQSTGWRRNDPEPAVPALRVFVHQILYQDDEFLLLTGHWPPTRTWVLDLPYYFILWQMWDGAKAIYEAWMGTCYVLRHMPQTLHSQVTIIEARGPHRSQGPHIVRGFHVELKHYAPLSGWLIWSQHILLIDRVHDVFKIAHEQLGSGLELKSTTKYVFMPLQFHQDWQNINKALISLIPWLVILWIARICNVASFVGNMEKKWTESFCNVLTGLLHHIEYLVETECRRHCILIRHQPGGSGKLHLQPSWARGFMTGVPPE